MGTLAQLLLVALIAGVASQTGHDHGGVDVFSQVLAKLNVTNAERLPFAATEKFVDRVFHRFTCSGNGTCQEAICLDTDGLFTLLGADKSLGLDEEQFHGLTSVLLYYVLHLSSHCHASVNPATANLTQIHEALKTRFDEENSGTISEEGIDHVLEGLVSSLSKEEHAEEDDHYHEEEGHDDDHADEVQVIEMKCLSADALLHEIRAEDGAPLSRMEDIALFLVYHLFTESTIKERCRLLPKKKYFLDELFEMYHAVNGTITKTEFTELLKALNLTMASNTTTDGDGHLHAHRRRRSAAVANARLQKVSRRRRAALDHAHDLGAPVWNKTCYSADQLMAVMGAQTGIREAEFRDLCPALLYQQVTGACLPMPSTQAPTTGSPTSDVQKWVFAMLAVLIISLCALVGGVLFCCRKARPGVYDSVKNVFLGLAVGTLVADAFLHLLPEALGLHSHGEESGAMQDPHAHASEGVVLEDSTQKMLLFVMVIFAMYLFETLTSHFCCMGHVHSHGPETQKYELHEAVHGHQPLETEGKTPEEKISRSCLQPVVLMVVIGDAIHNFADGLAIGAAFSISHAAGLATSIAVFCHELPHELGDLAVMLEAGLSMCWALVLNFVSALTAFFGAAVSLGLLSGLPQAQTWIFTIAAAIFTYIALVLIIPTLNLGKQTMSKAAQFLSIIMGMIIGIGIMLVLALFEEKLGNLAI